MDFTKAQFTFSELLILPKGSARYRLEKIHRSALLQGGYATF